MSGDIDYKNKILKATDSEFDFLGLQGLYFYFFLVGCGLAFAFMMILGLFEVNWIIRCFFPVIILVIFYLVAKKSSNKFGKGGYQAILEIDIPKKIKVSVTKSVYEKLV